MSTRKTYRYVVKKVERFDVWGVTGLVDGHYEREDYYWEILKFFNYDEKDNAYRFLRDLTGEDDE